MRRAGTLVADAGGAMRSPRRVLTTLFLIVFTDLVGFGIVIPLLPLYAEHYRPAPWVFGLLMATYSAMQFVFSPILGRLSDRVGRRPVLLVSLTGSVIGFVLFALANSLVLLFASRLLAGIAGGNIATAQAVIADTTAPEDRARGMGLIGAAFGLGFIAGPALAGLLAPISPAAPGWGAATCSLVAFAMTLAYLPETRPAEGAMPSSPR
jgi:DHA1 family tetracycline resistance protein-like MFS transporter